MIYFLIIELNIPLFKGAFEKYGDLFDFMDIPGLNEISDGNNVNDNFYFKEVIPVISPNIKFSILVFDCLKFDDEDSNNILIKLGGETNEDNENFVKMF